MRILLPLGFVAGALGAQQPTLTHGPFRGHVDETSLHVWARADRPGDYALELIDVAGDAAKTALATAAPERDLTLHFVVTGLVPGARFGLRVRAGDTLLHEAPGGSWSTAIPAASPTATIAFGSCADERGHPEQPIWDRLVARAPDALVLLGDTPYVDDGTVEGRRRRHREFFAFPPVARVLAAMPTWTTWDDHDYATNDLFGACKGSDTARGVFVDYHAHAGYGDGARGIWTGFRRGPIEVFLLDTRSFADVEESVLAPGQRSLLGRSQIEWLQAGLRGSTAPFKVLACGMVWNGGVRPNKLDCWGNWLPECDALLRWIGGEGIAGVVLVSGDVHRSRVVVHPVRDLAGYDLPELVTSPLAQNVLESNKVDVPGLVFDAGEADSCLFLTAVDGARGPELTATFLAGDGREFFRRTFAAGDLRAGDAAPVYRRVEVLLHEAFGADWARFPAPDDVSGQDVSAAAALGAPWREAVLAAGPAFAHWAKAVACKRCRFGAHGETPGLPEFFDRFLALSRLAALATARGHQAIADGEPAAQAAMVRGLLALAHHAFQEPTSIAWSFAHGVERRALALCTGTGADELRAHLAARPSPGDVAVPFQAETSRLVDLVLRGFRDERAGPRRLLAARHEAEARRACAAAVDRWLAALGRLGAAPDAEARAELRSLGDDLRERAAEVRRRLRGRADDDGERIGDAQDLADLVLSLAVPDVIALLDEHGAVAGELERAAAAAGRR